MQVDLRPLEFYESNKEEKKEGEREKEGGGISPTGN